MTIKLQQPPAEKLTISQNTKLKYLRINYLGSDVQSIINLTSSLVKQSLSVRTYKIECPIIFAEKKNWGAFALHNSSIFGGKKDGSVFTNNIFGNLISRLLCSNGPWENFSYWSCSFFCYYSSNGLCGINILVYSTTCWY